MWVSVLLLLLFPSELPLYEYREVVAAAIVVFTLLASIFSFVQEIQTNRMVRLFQSRREDTTTVVRDGRHSVIPIRQLVVGDLAVLSAGSRVPADLRVVESSGLEVDTSMLTGESKPRM